MVALSLVLLPHVTSGCYTYAVRRDTPPPGSRVVLDINDQGRVALGTRLGSELARVEGDLVSKSDTAFVIRMRQARTLGGVTTRWGGETVHLRDEYVKTVGERQFSRARTFFAAAGFAVAAGLLIAAQSLIGGGAGDGRDGGGPGGEV